MAYYNDPQQDPWTFIRAEDFFSSQSFFSPYNATLISQTPADNPEYVTKTGALFKLDGGSDSSQTGYLLIQFIRPQVFRIRFDPNITNETGNRYLDWNSRTIVASSLTKLVEALDAYEKISWKVEVDRTKDRSPTSPSDDNGIYYRIRTIVAHDTTSEIEMCILIHSQRLQITAIRALSLRDEKLECKEVKPKIYRVIWETTEIPLAWKKSLGAAAIKLTVNKPGSAKYIGFGEQGGTHLFKTKLFMNYFNYDNMRYKQVYNKGPTDAREPLYHSEPFWIELNSQQAFNSKVATFIDNFSQICIDFADKNAGRITTGTRFGELQYYVIAGNDIPHIIHLYTLMVGRQNLKPRYALGFHQGCYGYQDGRNPANEKGSQGWNVEDIVAGYQDRGFPLDGMHIDVDIQDRYRTFTIHEGRFPDAKGMFKRLRDRGVKCSTNITPVISCTADAQNEKYKTLIDGLDKKCFIFDHRKTDGFLNGRQAGSDDVKYMFYENGNRNSQDPKRMPDTFYPDNYNFGASYNQGVPFHGGVYYGWNYGSPGHYPNLNYYETRKWWGEQYEDLIRAGLEFVWQDMTTPSMAIPYGDMKSFPFRLLMDNDPWRGQQLTLPKLPAVEMWHLYSYNLHKATYHGLYRLDRKLNNERPEPERRPAKRNFIIGRGSFAGMYRYAGLWTGDNASSWEHYAISVGQVLAAGLSGINMAGADVGGFEQDDAVKNQIYADPELIIRWFCAYSLLPWFRCHYSSKPDRKWFQEPWQFTEHWRNNAKNLPAHEEHIYRSVEKICRYYIRLRYSLMQLLYDTMFDSTFTGLPIARALVVTDTLDEGLFTDFHDYVNDQYMVGNDLLVAPIMGKQKNQNGEEVGKRDSGRRNVYLPQPSSWYPFNLRVKFGSNNVPGGGKWKQDFDPTVDPGESLLESVDGGTLVDFGGNINDQTMNDDEANPQALQYVTPMYVREGAIIPQIGIRSHVPGPGEDLYLNPITIHIYPGGSESTYYLYLDDGVSMNSLSKHTVIAQLQGQARINYEADDKYKAIQIKQQWPTRMQVNNEGSRTVTLSTKFEDNIRYQGTPDAQFWGEVKKRTGDSVYVVLWHAKDVDMNQEVKLKMSDTRATAKLDKARKATILTIPVEINETFQVDCTWKYEEAQY